MTDILIRMPPYALALLGVILLLTASYAQSSVVVFAGTFAVLLAVLLADDRRVG